MTEEHARASGGIVARAEHWDVPLWANQGGPGDAAFQQVLQEHDYAGAVCIPVQRGEGALVFAAARSSGQPAFHIADVETFGLLARQADIALENSRLYEELREYVKQIQQSQLALIQAEKMSAVGRLTASIAHEVNNPLQAVQNCLHLSQRDELKIEKRTEYLQMADEELDRLMSTVQRMLDFYRPGALEKSETDLADLIGKVLALLEKQMQNQKIEVIQDIQPDLPEVLAVGNQIQQVFFNLVLNAMEAIEEDGIITITLRKEDSSVVAEIRDTGPGVDPGLQNTIFEPFVSSGVDGTGLGLSVSYGILTAHNGTLELVDDSKPGACFRVTLPLEVK
jgi:signal transduction histidine kinase